MSTVPYAATRADPTDIMGRRIGAYAIDFALAMAVVFAVALPVFFSQVDRVHTTRSTFCDTYNNSHSNSFCQVAGDTAYTLDSSSLSQLSRSFYGAFFGLTLLNGALLQGITGGTVGKLLLGLRVVRNDGERVGFGRCLLRTILFVAVDNLCFVVGLVLALTSKGHRRVGDMVAATLVVPKEYVGHPISVPGLATAWSPAASYLVPPPTAALRPSDDGPNWDPARNAYIQYDRPRSAWVQWDESAKEWKPIDSA